VLPAVIARLPQGCVPALYRRRVWEDPVRLSQVRIGTWNLEGRWSEEHQQLMRSGNCDVWLLTESPSALALEGFQQHRTTALMAPDKYWAAILSTMPLTPMADPHPATAAAWIGSLQVLSSVLPWRSCGSDWPGDSLADKQETAIESLRPVLTSSTTVWGGDWNQAFEGPEYVGTAYGRVTITSLLEEARLALTTGQLESASPGHASIDHIAVPADWRVTSANAISARASLRRLSDHDAYVVEVSDWDA